MAEYIWIDGYEPTANLRSKTKILDNAVSSVSDLPSWGFDGSSTLQAEGIDSDCMLKPVWFCKDPLRGGDNVLAMNEVCNPDGSPHKSNTRAPLVELAEKFKDHDPWFGIEQEYTLMDGNRPLGFPDYGFPNPQGMYYCSVGNKNVAGREIVEAHLDVCLEAGLSVTGINAEVLLGQWEFQVLGTNPYSAGDDLWMARYLLHRITEEFGVGIEFHP
jgi:glutamine synthetase